MQKDPRHDSNEANSSSLTYAPVDESLPNHPPSRIPLVKWQEMLEEERDGHVVGSIREEIVRAAVNAIYEGHLRRRVYGFVINRVHGDWLRAFQCVDSKSDDEEEALPPRDRLSEETSPSPIVEDSSTTTIPPPLPRRVPTVFGRLAKLAAGRESRCEAACANGTSRRPIKRAANARTRPKLR